MKGIVPDDILEALKKKKLGLPGIDIEAPVEKNAMMAGEFEVIMELLAAYGEADQAKIAKAQVKYSVEVLEAYKRMLYKLSLLYHNAILTSFSGRQAH